MCILRERSACASLLSTSLHSPGINATTPVVAQHAQRLCMFLYQCTMHAHNLYGMSAQVADMVHDLLGGKVHHATPRGAQTAADEDAKVLRRLKAMTLMEHHGWAPQVQFWQQPGTAMDVLFQIAASQACLPFLHPTVTVRSTRLRSRKTLSRESRYISEQLCADAASSIDSVRIISGRMPLLPHLYNAQPGENAEYIAHTL